LMKIEFSAIEARIILNLDVIRKTENGN